MEEFKKQKDADKYCLYQMYGHHPLYGRNVLLYIGSTTRSLEQRLQEHAWWAEKEYDRLTSCAGSLGEFESWKKWHDDPIEHYDKPESDLVEPVEQLLIYATQPAYNIKSKLSARGAKGLRIFNTGRFAQLFPEISYRYFVDDLDEE